MTGKPAPPYLHALTSARGIAAWLVVFYHIRGTMPWLPDSARAVFAKGYLAVDFFFLLSGFVIYFSSHRAMLDQGVAGIRPFLCRRLARIYPLYAVMLLLTIAFAAVLALSGRTAPGYPWAELPLHIAMMQNWGFTDALSWNHPAWSISTEMAAYLLFPLLLLATPIARAPRAALLAGMAILIAAMGLWLYAAGLDNLGQHIVRYGLIRCLFEFVTGSMLCALWLQSGTARHAGPLTIAAAIFGGAALLWHLHPRAELWAFPAMAAALIFLLADYARRTEAAGRRPSPPMQALRYLGEISYATYLSHYMLFTWFKIALVTDAAHIAPWKIGLFLLLTLVASSALYHLVELPGKRLVTALLRRDKRQAEGDPRLSPNRSR